MSLPYAWIALAIVAAVVEVLSPLFGFIFVSGAALGAALAAGLSVGLPGQVLAFTGLLLASLGLLRPRLVKRLSPTPSIPSRTERLQGLVGRVSEAIDPERGTGRVEVEGEDWAARCEVPLPAGSRAVVGGADGIVLIVSPAE